MKFFAALIAKLTGGDAAPKTLDQARSTFGEAKSALDKIGAMFAAAALDFDAMLAQGDNALKDFVAGLNAKVTTAEAKAVELEIQLSTLNTQLSTLSSEKTTLDSRLSTLDSLFSSIGFKPKADSKAEELQSAFTAHVSGAVTQKVQEIGFPAAKLPSASTAESITAAEDLRAEYNRLVASGDSQAAGAFWAKNVDRMFTASTN